MPMTKADRAVGASRMLSEIQRLTEAAPRTVSDLWRQISPNFPRTTFTNRVVAMEEQGVLRTWHVQGNRYVEVVKD